MNSINPTINSTALSTTPYYFDSFKSKKGDKSYQAFQLFATQLSLADFASLSLVSKDFRFTALKALVSPSPAVQEFISACKNGDVKTVKKFLNKENFDPAVNDDKGIRIASAAGQLEVVQELLKDNRVDASVRYNRASELAKKNGHTKVVEELSKNEKVMLIAAENLLKAPKGTKDFIKACRKGDLEGMKKLLKNDKADPADFDNKAIRIASRRNRVEVVKELLNDDRVNAADGNNKALKKALNKLHSKVLAELLQDKKVQNELEKSFLSLS